MELWTPSFLELSSRAEAKPETRDPSPALLIQNHRSERELPVMDPGSAHANGALVRDDSLGKQLTGHQLTTAELLYGLPDHPMLLQTYIWQDYDLAPRYPLLSRFIDFWQRDIEGKLHRVTVTQRETLGAAQFTFYAAEY